MSFLLPIILNLFIRICYDGLGFKVQISQLTDHNCSNLYNYFLIFWAAHNIWNILHHFVSWWKDGVLGARQSAESEALVGEVARGGQRRSVPHERYVKTRSVIKVRPRRAAGLSPGCSGGPLWTTFIWKRKEQEEGDPNHYTYTLTLSRQINVILSNYVFIMQVQL